MTSLLSCQRFPGVSSCQSGAGMLGCLLVFSWKLRWTAAASASCSATSIRFGHPGTQKDQGYTWQSNSTGSSLGRQRSHFSLPHFPACEDIALHLRKKYLLVHETFLSVSTKTTFPPHTDPKSSQKCMFIKFLRN